MKLKQLIQCHSKNEKEFKDVELQLFNEQIRLGTNWRYWNGHHVCLYLKLFKLQPTIQLTWWNKLNKKKITIDLKSGSDA